MLSRGLTGSPRARAAAEGRDEKKEILYAYLSGVEFRQRMETMVEAVLTLVNELHKEPPGGSRPGGLDGKSNSI